MDKKKTIVLGASPNSTRFSNITVKSLIRHSIEVIPIGIKHGEILGVEIQVSKQIYNDIHTITVYLNEENQLEYYDYILETSPVRLIFNPGAENADLEMLAKEHNIQVLNACTSVMINNGTY